MKLSSLKTPLTAVAVAAVVLTLAACGKKMVVALKSSKLVTKLSNSNCWLKTMLPIQNKALPLHKNW